MNRLKNGLILLLINLLLFFSNNRTYAQYISKDYKDSTINTVNGVPTTNIVNQSCLNKADLIIEGYYGYPYMTGILLKSVLDSSGSHYQTHNLNHVGLRFEYLIMKNFGVGLEYTYALFDAKYQENGNVYTATLTKQRFLGKAYLHFLEDDNTDGYITAGLGSSSTNISTNDPNNKVQQNITILPISIRLGVGFRHFFNQTIGINGEVGIGGPLIQGGISIRL